MKIRSSCCLSDQCFGCPMHRHCRVPGRQLSRREFLGRMTRAGAGLLALSAMPTSLLSQTASPPRRPPINLPLRVQPVLTYHLPQRREATSWREWGGLMNEQDVADEKNRLTRELAEMAGHADFPLELLPLVTVQNPEQAAHIATGNHDTLIIAAAGGSGRVLETLATPNKRNLMFVRHRSGPVYLWYEIAHPRFLRKTVDEFGQIGMDVHDVVVDEPADILWRLRALHALKNTFAKRIVAVGGASGWGAGGHNAPNLAKSIWKMDLVNVPYAELGPKIQQARQNQDLVKRCEAEAARYLAQEGVSLKTDRAFVVKAFLLTEVFRDLMDAAQTDAITVNSCMGTIMPMAETTACLPLSLLNDDGYLAFCESDFVVIPSGVLLHYISGKPVFLNDPTYPHHQVVTLAHCTAPRKMNGHDLEKAILLTHFESDYGAAPKVEMKIGQAVTTIAPDFAFKKWVGFGGAIAANPALAICRSQIDVQINGNTEQLLEKMQGFHWMTCYGDYLRETGYALKKAGIQWENISPA